MLTSNYMNTISELLEAFLECPTKCYLRSIGEAALHNPYADWKKTQNDAYVEEARQRLLEGETLNQGEILVSPVIKKLKAANWRMAMDVLIQTENMESRLQAIEFVSSARRGKQSELIPIRFIPHKKLTQNHRLLLTFDTFVLSTFLGREVHFGKIIHGDDYRSQMVRTAALSLEIRKLVEKLAELQAGGAMPDLTLIRHCVECEFRDHCREKALEKDDLSLLAGLSGKERKKYHAKGIFTITQLSYTYRPRRRPKRLRERHEKYQHSLKALAIREKKIYVVGSPEMKIEGTPVFLDVESVPDRDFYYLIGLRVKAGDSVTQHSLWAEDLQGEEKIWMQFCNIIARIANPVLIHYGNFEKTFFKRMCERYGHHDDRSMIAKAIVSSVNVLSVIFAHIYFPTYTNSLKDIASLFGARWSLLDSTGLQSIMWRQCWESGRDVMFKERLLNYNMEDCIALDVLTTELQQLLANQRSRADVCIADEPKTPRSTRAAEIHGALSRVLRSAYSDYSKARIQLCEVGGESHSALSNKNVRRHHAEHKLPGVKGRIVRVPRKRKCPRHPEQPMLLRPQSKLREHVLTDIAFTSLGCRKSVVRYVGRNGRCPHCHNTYPAPGVKRVRNQRYDSGFYAWVVYLRMVLRLSYRLIRKATDDLFHEPLTLQTAEAIVQRTSEKYRHTEELLLQRILASPAVHLDETRISILGIQQYVWVFTDGKHVIFRLTERRQTDFLTPIFSGYAGTLVSDFYGGYDALPCRQQKCLVHLIRDLNDTLWNNPFDLAFENFVAEIRDLLVPMMMDIRKFGLKSYHLRKHSARVVDFYRRVIEKPSSDHELIATYRKRFLRYRDSLFTFLERDDVSWNNNTAERALRHFAVQRKISGAFSSKGANHYLRLLSIAQSCRFQAKSFLGFLLSGITDVDSYREARRRSARLDADLEQD